jgi:hypothetical protein
MMRALAMPIRLLEERTLYWVAVLAETQMPKVVTASR